MEKVVVYKPKKGQTGDPEKLDRSQLSSIGKIHLTVCSPNGKRVVGFLIKRPDIAGMVKQKDVFIALDSFVVSDYGLVATRGDESFDDAARERLHLPWEKCIIWAGMDAKTTNGRELGWVADFSFDGKSGKISTFFVGDGGVAGSLVGYIEIPASMLRGYSDGFMLVDPEASKLALDGGLAAKAGEGYARAKIEGKAAGKKAAKVAGTAVEKGAYGLGKLIGKTKRAIEDYQRDDEDAKGEPAKSPVEVESISEPVSPDLLDDGSAKEPAGAASSESTPDANPQGANESATASEGVSSEPTSGAAGTAAPEDKGASGESDASAEPQLRTFVAASEAEGQVAGKEAADGERQAVKAPSSPSAQDSAPAQKSASTAQAEPKPKPKKKATSTKAKPKEKSLGDEAARAFGRGLGKMNSMFGSFVDEYKKSSK